MARRHRGTSGAADIELPHRRLGPFESIWLRVAVACACLVITTLVVWFGRAGYRDLDGRLTDFWSCLYYATVSLSTTGYGDITPVTTWARMVNVLVITPLRLIFLITLVGTTVEVLTSRGRDEIRLKRWRDKVHDHTIVMGFGVKGRTAVTTLLESGVSPRDIVVVADNAGSCDEASALGVVTARGDGRREDVLMDASMPTAKSVIIAADSDDVAVLMTLTARRLNPTAFISVAARERANGTVLRQSGANAVIMTAESAGRMLAVSQLSPTAGEVLEDLIDPGHGLEVVERVITPEELGMSPGSLSKQGNLVLSVIREGVPHRFDTDDIRTLQRGDRVVVIRHAGNERASE